VALELAEETGTASFTVQDVLQRADVSLQTFYRHFQSKDELLLAVLEESVTERTAAWRTEVGRLRDPVARVESIVKRPFSVSSPLAPTIVHEHIRLMERYAREVRAADEPYRQLLTGAIEDAQAIGRFIGVDAADEAELIMALVLARYHNLLLGVVTRSSTAEAKHLWVFCLAALVRNEGTQPEGRRQRAQK
jgi:AcrR family transcriptional regulator